MTCWGQSRFLCEHKHQEQQRSPDPILAKLSTDPQQQRIGKKSLPDSLTSKPTLNFVSAHTVGIEKRLRNE